MKEELGKVKAADGMRAHEKTQDEMLRAATARADAAERKVGDLVDLVEDRLNYIDDRHVVKELRAALAAALPTKPGAR